MVSATLRIIILLFILMEKKINAKLLEDFSDLPDIREGMSYIGDWSQMELLNNCFADRLQFVITSTELHRIFFDFPWDLGPPPIMSIDENFKSNGDKVLLLHMPTFVLAPRSIESFGALLHSIKSSQWWHIDAFFFIVGNSAEGCEPAAEILQQLWKMNLLSTLYLCYEPNKGLMLYTYNPYTNRAPRPWKEIREFKKPDDRWTLYAQPFSSGLKNCANLIFDKTKFLDGYKIKSVQDHAAEGKRIINKNPGGHDKQFGSKENSVSSSFLQHLFHAMNISTTLNYDDPGYFNNGKAVGYLVKLLNGSYDIALSLRLSSINLTSMIYPLIQGNPQILTQQKKFLTPVEKILSFYSSGIMYLTGIVLFITFLFILLIYKKREFAFAAFDVLRLLLSVGLHVPFNRTATRIYIFCVFQLIIILNATFQGNISAFLTKPERPYVDSVEDLQKYQYKIYAPLQFQEYVNRVMPGMTKINYVPSKDCAQYVADNPSAACINTPNWLLKAALNHGLHISQTNFLKEYLTMWCRDDWPIKKKIDHYMLHAIGAGLWEYYIEHRLNVPLRKLQSREDDQTAAQYRPIDLDDLLFAFRFLAIGLGVSILVFIIEIFPWHKFSRKVKKTMEKFKKFWIMLKLKLRR